MIHSKPSPILNMVIVIPCYNEPELLLSLMALQKCTLPKWGVEVIVVINDSETDSEAIKDQNMKTYKQASNWADKQIQTSSIRFHILYESNLRKKYAGVGLARKIGMDEAVIRLEKIKNRRGIIVCFDADSRCEKNYLVAIENHFSERRRTKACGIHFEHPLMGYDYGEEVYESIILYELHLRYFINAQKWAGFPFAFQTIGSSMAVRCDAYQAQGGMNKRKAGEDFYFLHKFIENVGFTEIKNTKVIPSPRISDRVPFGTGKAVGDILKNKKTYKTYAPQSFQDLKVFFKSIRFLFEIKLEEMPAYLESLPASVRSFLIENDFQEKVFEIQKNTTSKSKFINRFFRWFNAFLLMKYVHHARDHFYPNIGVKEAAEWLLKELNVDKKMGEKEMLLELRERDRS